MKTGVEWGSIDPNTIEGFDQLGQREQKAVGVAFEELALRKQNRVKPRPMRVTVTPDQPFNLRDFAQVLHTAGVSIGHSLIRSELPDRTILTFQPEPYDRLQQPKAKNREEIMAALDTVLGEIRRELFPLAGTLRRFGIEL